MDSLTVFKTPKNVLVTGGVGFIGSHLVEALLKKNIHIVVPYIEINPNSYFLQKQFEKRIVIEKADITNAYLLEQIIHKHSIDFIYHLAAQTIVATAYIDPYVTLNTNIMGTVNLLEIMRKNPAIKGMIFASTDKAYGKTTEKYTEEHPLKGDHPYDVSKSSADLIAQTYYKTYKTPVVITRFGNVYGEGDLHMERIIPGICQSIVKNEVLQIRSDGTFVRDYIYVKDVVDGYILLSEKFKEVQGEAFNFSSSDSFSVLEVINKVRDILRKDIPYKILNTAINEIPYQHLDDAKVRKLGWRPHNSFETSLKTTLKWYKDILKNNEV